MSATIIPYWEFESQRASPLTCPSGASIGSAECYEGPHGDLLDVCCPECDCMILIVPFPTVGQTQAAAAADERTAATEPPEERR